MSINMTKISKNYCTALIISFLIFTSNICSNSISQISYTGHCSSFVPEPTQTESPSSFQSGLSFIEYFGYYTSQSSSSSSSNSLVLRLSNVYTTGVQAFFRVEANLEIKSRYFKYTSRPFSPGPAFLGRTRSSRRSSTTTSLWLRGFWSESSGNMCLVGGVRRYQRDDMSSFIVSLRLYNIKDSSNLTSLVTGVLESLLSSDEADNQNSFSPVSFILFTRSNYEYTLASEKLKSESFFGDEDDLSPGLPLSSFSIYMAVKMFSRTLELKYSGRCAKASFAKNCSPFGDFLDSFLPSVVRLRRIDILRDKPARLRVLIKFSTGANESFSDYETLDPNTTLVGEGVWDEDKNQMFFVACRFLNAMESWAEARIGDCSTRLSLRFPAVWSMGHISSVVGRIWSTKNETDSGYFEEIGFRRSESLSSASLAGMKYEYTRIDVAKKWCLENRLGRDEKSDRKAYPNAFSYDMRFDMFSSASKSSNVSRGYARPITVGYDGLWHWRDKSFLENVRGSRAFNVSYEIGVALTPKSFLSNNALVENWVISAEGTYDESTGSLCMVGCRYLGPVIPGDLDCEIIVSFQFPPKEDSSKNPGFIHGIIKSRRIKTDPFHFDLIELSSASFVVSEAKKSIRKADLEIIRTVFSDALSCVFVAAQIFHLRRNPDSLPFVSLTAICALVFGHATESLPVSSSKSLLATGRFEARELTRGVAALVLISLQSRLLWFVWFGRLGRDSPEKKAVLVSLPVYFGGAIWSVFSGALKSYAKIVSEGFLFPQILLNAFADSSGKSLSCYFYVGTTLVRVFAHGYDLYNAQSSAYWDVIVPLMSLLFAALVYLQQKFGGRCILPRRLRFRESVVYEKVSTNVSEVET